MVLGQWWMESVAAGKIKKKIYQILRQLYDFGAWHTEPINERPYAQEIVKMLNKRIDGNKFNKNAPIVEVGCGLGDIIGSIKWKYGKIGYDISEEVLKGASLLHPDIKFYNGTFADINCGEINCLIMVNFIHMIPCDKLKKNIDIVLKNNRVEMFVLDTITDNEGTVYEYSHNGKYLFNGKYKMVRKSEIFPCVQGAKRHIEYWRIRED